MKWYRVNEGKIDVPLEDYIKEIVKSERLTGKDVTVAIGTDAQRRGKKHKFVTVIAIITEGNGGKIIYTSKYIKDKLTMNQKLLKEVYMSMDVAFQLSNLLDELNIKPEIHVDINSNPNHPSNKVLSQSVGYILGMGYDYKVKPDAYASSYCADRISKL
jgi:predicted RNase H-related nuclease YkuK (DUF458 family)